MSLAKEYFVNTYGWRKDWDSPTTDSLDDVVKRLENVSLITYYFIHMLIRVVGRLKVFEFVRKNIFPSHLTLLGKDGAYLARFNRWYGKHARSKTLKSGGENAEFFQADDFEELVQDDLLGMGVEVGIPDQVVPDPFEPPPPKTMRLEFATRNELVAHIRELEIKLEVKDEQIANLHRTIGGNRRALLASNEKLSSIAELGCDRCKGYADIVDSTLLSNGFIQLTERLDCNLEHSDVFKGKEYFSFDSVTRKTTGKPKVYVGLGYAKRFSTVSRIEQNRRASLAIVVLSLIAGCSWEGIGGVDCNDELILLFSKIFAKKMELFQFCKSTFGMLSVSQAVDLRSLLRMSMSAFRRMRTILNSENIHIHIWHGIKNGLKEQRYT